MWNDLKMSERNDIIALAVSQGITDIDDIRNLYEQGNIFATGGKKPDPPRKKVSYTGEDTFNHYWERAVSRHPKYDTPEWRAFFRDIAFQESGFNPFIVGPAVKRKNGTNDYGRGYFGIMDTSRGANSDGSKMFNWTTNAAGIDLLFDNAFWLMDYNLATINNRIKLSPKLARIVKENKLSKYALGAGAWAAGASGLCDALISGKDRVDLVFGNVSAFKQVAKYNNKDYSHPSTAIENSPVTFTYANPDGSGKFFDPNVNSQYILEPDTIVVDPAIKAMFDLKTQDILSRLNIDIEAEEKAHLKFNGLLQLSQEPKNKEIKKGTDFFRNLLQLSSLLKNYVEQPPQLEAAQGLPFADNEVLRRYDYYNKAMNLEEHPAYRGYSNGGNLFYEEEPIKNGTAGSYRDAVWSGNSKFVRNPDRQYIRPLFENLPLLILNTIVPKDSRGHRNDIVKSNLHPTSPVRGNFSEVNGVPVFELSELGMQDSNYTIFGADDNGDSNVVVTNKGAAVIPEITITPNGSYYEDNYDGFEHSYNKGGKIYIKPSKRGSFRAAAKKHGKSVQAFASQVLANKDKYSSAMVKKANFARNAAKWHDDGGPLDEEYYGKTLPAVEVTAPRRYVAGYDSLGNPIHTSDPNLSMGYNPTSSISKKQFMGFTPGTYGHDIGNAAALMIGTPMATVAAGPLVAEGLKLAAPYAKAGLELMGRPTSSLVKGISGTQKLLPYAEAFDRSLWGASGALGMYDAGRKLYNGEGPWYENALEGGLSALMLTELGPAFKGIKNAVKLSSKPLISPLMVKGTTIVDNQSELSPSSLGMKGLPIEPKSVQIPFKIKTYPGYQLKALMRGNPLERLLSKTGTINVNSIKAQAAKGSKVEKAVIDEVLSSEQFAGQKAINYNDFRKAVQDKLITYDRVPSDKWADYGLKSLGFNGQTTSDEPLRFNVETGEYELVTLPVLSTPNYTLSTYTFESPKIPFGSAKHYNPATLGHSRTYTTTDEPDVLHVMESQSDWAQLDLVGLQLSKEEYNSTILSLKTKLKGYRDEIKRIDLQIRDPKLSDYEVLKLDEERDNLYNLLNENAVVLSNIQDIGFSTPLSQYLSKNYLQRLLQENLKYAAEHGQTKMRYPTPETAAKIEGYVKERKPTDEYKSLQKEYEKLLLENKGPIDSWPQELQIKAQNYDNQLAELDLSGRGFTEDYIPKHQTILKKYAEFPKMYRKLYKSAEVRTITDSKGNTWYEVDVPKDYLNQEWQYKYGGNLFYEGGPKDKLPKTKDLNSTGETQEEYYTRKSNEIARERKALETQYAIPIIPSKMISLTGDTPYLDRGAIFSENLLDSIYKNARAVGLPFSEGLGLVAQESTLANAKNRGMGVGYDHKNNNGTWTPRRIGMLYSPVVVTSDWSYINDNPYNDALAYARKKPNTELRLKNGLIYTENLMKKFNIKTPPLLHAFELFKAGKYNPGEPDHKPKAIKRGEDIIKYSPEVQRWMKRNNVK